VTRFRVGCSGWNYADWRGDIYPARLPASRWLEHYAERFDTVEVNSTFYRLPNATAVARWVEQTPPEFVFAVKASRYLTHVRRLRELRDGVARLAERIEPLISAGRLGPVLWQLPANFHRDDERLAAALAETGDGRHAFEFRHESWFTADVYALLREHGAALVVGDHPARPFQPLLATADWTFVRFHYGARGRAGNYSERELGEWAQRLASFAVAGDAFVYFNNDWKGYAPRNALSLARLLGAPAYSSSSSSARPSSSSRSPRSSSS
jgi:uncharacterized protein YecE (DUF72 family)